MAQVSSIICVAGSAGNLSTVADTTMSLPDTAKTIAVPVTEAVAASGELLVSALLSDFGLRGIWRGVPGDLAKIATTGDAVPALPSTTFGSATSPNMSGNGTVAFHGLLSGDSAFNESIWKATPGSLSLVIRKGSAVLSGEVVTSLGRPTVNDAGVVVFSTTTTTGGGRDSGSARLRESRGSSLRDWRPPASLAGPFSDFAFPSLNASGQVAFGATLKSGAATARSLWLRQANGALHLLARVGGALPTRAGSGTVNLLLVPSYTLADDGSVVFVAQLGPDYELYHARAKVAAKTSPVVRFSAKVFRTAGSRALVRGTVSSPSRVSRVLVRPKAAKTYTKARGTVKWSARVKAPKGRSKVRVQAVTVDGTRSKIVSARILRTK